MTEERLIEFIEEPYAMIGKLKLIKGSRLGFPKAEADQYIAAGWAKCVATGETGERKAGHKAMQVDDSYVAMQ